MDIKYKKEKDLQSHYDNTQYYSPLIGKPYFQNLCNSLKISMQDINSILDLGCGDGRLCQHIPKLSTYTGVDYSVKRIELAKKTYPSYKFIAEDLHIFIDTTDMKPDLIVCVEVLEHLEVPKKLLDIIKDRMPNSIIIGTVPINMPYIAHLQVWETEEQLKQHLNPDYIKIDPLNKHWMCKWNKYEN
jgi:2-polyprenyl-3-methyl-5-hydroxy-6-metoxy-1,4-benzoquinol methylase